MREPSCSGAAGKSNKTCLRHASAGLSSGHKRRMLGLHRMNAAIWVTPTARQWNRMAERSRQTVHIVRPDIFPTCLPYTMRRIGPLMSVQCAA